MTTVEIPQLKPMPTMNPEPAHPGLDYRIGDLPKPVPLTASKKVDDLSRHESKHDGNPKHDPKLNPREKSPEARPPSVGKPQVGATKK